MIFFFHGPIICLDLTLNINVTKAVENEQKGKIHALWVLSDTIPRRLSSTFLLCTNKMAIGKSAQDLENV